MAYEHLSYYSDSDHDVSTARIADEKATFEYHTFGHIPLPSDDPAAREDQSSPRSGWRLNSRSRLLLV